MRFKVGDKVRIKKIFNGYGGAAIDRKEILPGKVYTVERISGTGATEGCIIWFKDKSCGAYCRAMEKVSHTSHLPDFL